MGEWTKAKTKDLKMYFEETANESLTSTEMMSPSLQIQQEKNKNQSAFSLTSQKWSVIFVLLYKLLYCFWWIHFSI